MIAGSEAVGNEVAATANDHDAAAIWKGPA